MCTVWFVVVKLNTLSLLPHYIKQREVFGGLLCGFPFRLTHLEGFLERCVLLAHKFYFSKFQGFFKIHFPSNVCDLKRISLRNE